MKWPSGLEGLLSHPEMLFEDEALEICAWKEIREDAWLFCFPEYWKTILFRNTSRFYQTNRRQIPRRRYSGSPPCEAMDSQENATLQGTSYIAFCVRFWNVEHQAVSGSALTRRWGCMVSQWCCWRLSSAAICWGNGHRHFGRTFAVIYKLQQVKHEEGGTTRLRNLRNHSHNDTSYPRKPESHSSVVIIIITFFLFLQCAIPKYILCPFKFVGFR
jgi:hypothetical protein